jgi:glycosyltransferase involved in cell wall biosynthesis
VLTTYNSEPYLPALLDSLFAQSRQDFTLLVADDASTDGTEAIIEAYSRRYPGRIREIPAEGPRRGVVANFDRALACSNAQYLFLCDHDDVWLPHKIERTLEAMHALEAEHPPGTPLLVHTDLVIVTGPDLDVMAPSFFEYSGIDPRRKDLVQLLLANVATGCTTVINRALWMRARPIPPEAMMYDHWLALVAVAAGAMTFIEDRTILYRQHETNSIGARRPSLFRRIYGTLVSRERERVLKRYSRQAAVLVERFGGEMSPSHRSATQTLARLWDMPRLRRYAALRDCGLCLEGLMRNVALFVVVTRGSRGALPNEPA